MNGITFFTSYYEALKRMDDDDRLQAMDALLKYAIEGEESEDLSPVADMFMILVKPNVDASAKARRNGAKGGRSNSEAPLDESAKHPSEDCGSTLDESAEAPLSESPKRKGIGEGIGIGEGEEKREERKRFTPPSADAVREYCAQSGYTSVDPEAFVDFYTSKGWCIGKAPMKDWKAAVRTWAKRRDAPAPRARTSPTANPPGRDYNWADMERMLLSAQQEGRNHHDQIQGDRRRPDRQA